MIQNIIFGYVYVHVNVVFDKLKTPSLCTGSLYSRASLPVHVTTRSCVFCEVNLIKNL